MSRLGSNLRKLTSETWIFTESMPVRDPNAFEHLPKDSGQPTCGRFHRHAETDASAERIARLRS